MEKFVRVAAPAQRYKSVSLRDCFNRMSKGLPINATMHQLHDLPEDVEMDAEFYDEFSDSLEVRQVMFDEYERKQEKAANEKAAKEKAAKEKAAKEKAAKDAVDSGKNPLNLKGGIPNETSPDEVPQES